MGLDALSPVAPARIQCLLLPCGRIKRSRFLDLAERLQQVGTVRLGDISPNGRPHRTMFSPLAFPTGLIVYNMLVSVPPASHLALVPFELYREPLAIIGIAEGGIFAYDDLEKGQSASNGDTNGASEQGTTDKNERFGSLMECVMGMKEQYPSALVHQVFLFDYDTSDPLPAALVPVPSPEHSKTTTMKTLMCDLTSLLLAEMTSYAKSLQALPNIETPKPLQNERLSNDYYTNSISQPDGPSRLESRISSTPGSRSSSPAPEADRSLHRTSIPTRLASGRPLSAEGSRSTSLSNGTRTPPVTFEEMDGLPEKPGVSTDQEKARRLSKDRVPVHGFGSGSFGERARNKARGRIGVVIGSMYLLAGRWPDAVKELVDSATIARANSDHVWHAKALDYILVCLLMYAWSGMDFEIPQICYPIREKSSSASSKSSKLTSSNAILDPPSLKTANAANRLVSLQNLCQLLPDLVNNILHLYVRAATFTADQVPQIAFSESTIRFSKLLATVQASHGLLDDHGLRSVVLNVHERQPYDSAPTHFASFLTKSEIAAVLFRALPSSTSEKTMDVIDRLKILAGIASVLSLLGFHRKKAFILKELASILLPALVQSRKDSAAELGVHPAASLSSFDLNGAGMGLEDVFGRYSSSEHGAQSFLASVCEIYGVVLSTSQASRRVKLDQDSTQVDTMSGRLEVLYTAAAVEARALRHATLRSFGNQALKLDVLRASINICEALPDFRGVLRFSSDLLRTAGSGIVPASDTSDGSPSLSIEDQGRLSQNVSRTVGAARQLGLDHVEAEYWDEFLVRGIKILNSKHDKALALHDKTHLAIAAELSNEKEKSPFIYNPFVTKPLSPAEALLIAHEEANFGVTVQNLYDFDLEIEWIKLDSSDVLMETMVRGVVIGPYRTQEIQLLGTPKTSGSLTITGCKAKIKGCQERGFPIFQTPWKVKQDGKIKLLGLAAANLEKFRPVSATSDPTRGQRGPVLKGPIASNLTVKVIEPQPNLILKDISLPQFAIMLLDGETKNFKITLQNASSMVSVDLLLPTFTDSTLSTLQPALSKKDLSPSEIYEVEFSFYRREAFKWRRQAEEAELFIAPNGDTTLEIEVLGKRGLTHGTIQIDYGHLGMPRADVKDEFYTRQLIIPITITVNSSVSLIRNDFLPFTGDFAWHNQQRQQLPNGSAHSTPPDRRSRAISRASTKTENRFQSLLKRLGLGSHGNDHCLLLLDFHNSWPNPLSISVQVRESLSKPSSPYDPWKRAYSVHEVIQPGHTSRLVLLLPRIFLPDPYGPVPSLNIANKRQYVVGASKISPEAERASRELFWYREEVLKHIRASWEEDTTGRTGDIPLRTLQLTSSMVQALKLEDVAISLHLTGSETPHSSETPTPAVDQTARSSFSTTTDAFLTLHITIHNRLPTPIYPLLRLQPCVRHQANPATALDLAKKFAFNGLLQQALPLLKAGESRQLELGCAFLCSGEFKIAAMVEEVSVWKAAKDEEGSVKGEDGLLDGGLVDGSGERRIWAAREPCVVVVRDEDRGEGAW